MRGAQRPHQREHRDARLVRCSGSPCGAHKSDVPSSNAISNNSLKREVQLANYPRCADRTGFAHIGAGAYVVAIIMQLVREQTHTRANTHAADMQMGSGLEGGTRSNMGRCRLVLHLFSGVRVETFASPRPRGLSDSRLTWCQVQFQEKERIKCGDNYAVQWDRMCDGFFG